MLPELGFPFSHSFLRSMNVVNIYKIHYLHISALEQECSGPLTPACMQLLGQVQGILPASKAAAGSERTRGRAAAAASSREAAGSAWGEAHSWVEGCSGPEQACSAAMCCRKLAAAADTSMGMAGSASVPARPWVAAGSCSCHSLWCQKRKLVLFFYGQFNSGAGKACGPNAC